MEFEVTEFEKRIYNNHLISSRKMKNKPFKIRKDFSKLSEDIIINLKSLSKFFNSYGHIDQMEFFSAPHKVYPDEDCFYLDYYLTRKAIKAYSLYMKELELENPDSPTSLTRLMNSFNFVSKYCSDNEISLDKYESYTKGSLPEYITHLKNHKINFYTIHALQFKNPDVESQILDFIFKDFYIIYQKTKNSFFSSVKMKQFARLAKQKINDKLKTEIEKKTNN